MLWYDMIWYGSCLAVWFSRLNEWALCVHLSEYIRFSVLHSSHASHFSYSFSSLYQLRCSSYPISIWSYFFRSFSCPCSFSSSSFCSYSSFFSFCLFSYSFFTTSRSGGKQDQSDLNVLPLPLHVEVRKYYDVMWCDVMWCDVMSCDVMWCDVMWCDMM